MRLFLGVCKGLKALHGHRLKGPSARATGERGPDETTEPLMTSEIMSGRDGVQEGEIRAYAHRDIKPG